MLTLARNRDGDFGYSQGQLIVGLYLHSDYPYWNWPADAHSIETSPIFDGSDTSMPGNGAYIPDKGDIALTLGNYPIIYLPAGTAGGCVTSGPFVNYTVNLGPAGLSLPGGGMAVHPKPLDDNPRCLKRDLSTAIPQRYSNATAVVKLLLDNKDIWDFQMVMQGVPGSGSIGVHGGGHNYMGGDPGRDVFVGPRGPGLLAASWDDRPRVVDLAGVGYQEQTVCYLGDGYVPELSGVA